MSEHEEMTPETLRKAAKIYRVTAETMREMYPRVSETHATTAGILDGLAALWERNRELASIGHDWHTLGLSLSESYPTPVAALVALGREARDGHAVTVNCGGKARVVVQEKADV
jgi:hypothetical protein